MKSILVYFYGYKSKLLPQAVEQLIKNQSGENSVHIIVYDQTNVSRPDKFLDIEYNHIHWDSLISRFIHLNYLKKRKGFDFFMYIDGAKMFEKNWDSELLLNSNQAEIIISGNHNIVFDKNNYKFYPEYKKIETGSATLTNWLVKEFFFIPFGLFKRLPDISMFKYYGVEECLSMFAAHESIPILSVATSLVNDEEPSILEKDFVPFALRHNYSKIIDSFKNKSSDILGVDQLMKIIDYDFSRLAYFPYPMDDVEYVPLTNLDGMSERRFHEVQKSIY
jgi:hypothetical protein